MNKVFATIAGIFLLCLMLPQKLLAQNTLVTEISDVYLDKLISTAKTNYPHIKSLNSRITTAQTNLTRTKYSYLDVITFSYVYQPNNTVNLNAYQYGTDPALSGTTTNTRTAFFNGSQVGVFFNLGAYLQKPLAVKQAKEELSVANNELQEYLITLATQVKKRYYIYLQRLAALKLQNQATIDVESGLKDIKYRFEKGEETLDNYNKARLTLTQQNQAKIVAEADLFLAKADLEELLGDKLENIK